MSDGLEFDFLHMLGRHIAQNDTLDEILASVVDLAVALVNCDECLTYVRDNSELLPWVWKHTELEFVEHSSLPMDSDCVAALAEQRAPLAVSEGDRGNRTRPFNEWSTDPGETRVFVPMLAQSNLVGAIVLHHRRPRKYSLREVRYFSTVGYLLGGDIRISQLKQQNDDLILELETRKLVERGKGILQRELGLSEHQAYLALQHQSQQKKRPMKEIAQAIILCAEVRQSVGQD